jgi:predicted nucleic acid-binding Zn ribbon protein
VRRQKRAIDFNVKSAVKDALHRLNLDARMREYAVWGVWTKAVGDTIAQQAQPAFVRGGILFVKCSSSAWIQQLHFMKGTIRDSLNRLLGNEVIKDIRFQMGVISLPDQVAPVVEDQKVVLDDAERKRIDEALSPLTDPETREVARRIMVKEAAKKTGSRRAK